MRQFKLLLAALLVAVCGLPVWAQGDIWVNGTVFSEKDDVQTVVPFATVKFYNDKAMKDMAYYAVCGPFGNYTIKPYNYKKEYYILVEADGHNPRKLHISPVPETSNGKKFTGNTSVHVRLTPESNYKPCGSRVIMKNDIPSGMTDVKQYLTSLDDINSDSEGWFTDDERGILFCINGMPISEKQVAALGRLPIIGVKKITIYETGATSPYGKAVDITIATGKPATAPDFRLWESTLVD